MHEERDFGVGRFTWREYTDKDVEYKDELETILNVFLEFGLADRLAERLHQQKYLTEGDVAGLIGMKSKLNHPGNFFCGDRGEYDNM